MNRKVSLRQIFHVFRREYVEWITNPRMIVCLVLLVMIREVVILPMKELAADMGQPINAIEPAIAVANSGILLLLMPLVYLVIMADFPRVSGNTYFYLTRIGRLNWIFGQMLFQLISLLTYLVFVVVSTMIQTISFSYMINGWSLVVTTNDGLNAVNDLLPINIYNQMTPYRAFAESYLLLFLFFILCSSVMLLAALYGRKTLAFWTVMLTVAAGIVFCALKSKWMWVFPVSHSILWIHFQTYYRKYVLSPTVSILGLLLLIVVVYVVIMVSSRRMDVDRLRSEQE